MKTELIGYTLYTWYLLQHIVFTNINFYYSLVVIYLPRYAYSSYKITWDRIIYRQKKANRRSKARILFASQSSISANSGRPISWLFARDNKITTGENDQQTPAIYVSKELNSFWINYENRCGVQSTNPTGSIRPPSYNGLLLFS